MKNYIGKIGKPWYKCTKHESKLNLKNIILINSLKTLLTHASYTINL